MESEPMRLVIVESPYAGDIGRNVAYARRCMHDCLQRGEAPLASHLLYTQPGVLDDGAPDERALGIEAGLAWGRLADATIVYSDLGITDGMSQGIVRAKAEGRPVLFRRLDDPDAPMEDAVAALPPFASADYLALVGRIAARANPTDTAHRASEQTVIDVLEALRIDESFRAGEPGD